MKTCMAYIRLAMVLVVLGLAAPLAACFTPTTESAAGSNEAVIREVIGLINDRDLDQAFELYALDYVYHGPGGQELRGRKAIKGLWEIFLTGFPNLSARIDDVIEHDDKVALRWTVTGTHMGEFLGVAPTGNEIALGITEIFRVEGGQLVEAWDQYDRLHLMQQIGEFTGNTQEDPG
jgi:steroid delta-isomerase-like uncharacterized protein